MLKARILKDGSIIFPKRGKAPATPQGYLTTSDPYIFKPDLEYCKYRTIRKHNSNCCGGSSEYLYCIKFKTLVTPKTCKDCINKGEL